MIKRLSLLTILLTSIACSKEDTNQIEVGRTEDGTLKYRAQLKNGVRDGLLTEYYPDGSVESKGYWKGGQAHGETWRYYERGSLKAKATWKNGHRVGYYQIFYPNGNILERRLYNEKGDLVYFRKFKKEGDIDFESMATIFSTNKDTLTLGDKLILQIEFGIPLFGEVSIEIGNMIIVDSVNYDFVSDTTLQDISNSKTFEYAVKAQEPGHNKITVYVEFMSSEKDTIPSQSWYEDFDYYVIR